MYFIAKGDAIRAIDSYMGNKKKAEFPAFKGFFAVFFATVLILSGCDVKNTGPKTMPAPNANVVMPPTPGPTIIPQITEPASEAAVTGNETSAGDGTEGSESSLGGTKKEQTVVVLDPGHGGKFTGAIYFGNSEKDLTLKVANYIRDYLLENYEDIEVYLTRETDIALDNDIKIELENRAIVAKDYGADYFVSLHFNASEEHQLNGVTVYASFRDNVAEKSQGIAASILEQLVALGLKNNSVKTRVSKDYFAEDGSRLDYYAVIRHSALRDIPGVIVEHCFMDNETDKEYMDTDEKLQALAEADAKGIANYLELKPVN